MARNNISKEVFLAIATSLGFDPKDSHMEDLYPEVCNLMKAADQIDELDLTDIDPQTIFIPPKA
jgi:hypothetical protein